MEKVGKPEYDYIFLTKESVPQNILENNSLKILFIEEIKDDLEREDWILWWNEEPFAGAF